MAIYSEKWLLLHALLKQGQLRASKVGAQQTLRPRRLHCESLTGFLVSARVWVLAELGLGPETHIWTTLWERTGNYSACIIGLGHPASCSHSTLEVTLPTALPCEPWRAEARLQPQPQEGAASPSPGLYSSLPAFLTLKCKWFNS